MQPRTDLVKTVYLQQQKSILIGTSARSGNTNAPKQLDSGRQEKVPQNFVGCIVPAEGLILVQFEVGFCKFYKTKHRKQFYQKFFSTFHF